MPLPDREFRRFIETAPVACVIVDSDGNLSLVNPEAETMFGYRKEELCGQSMLELIPERSRSRVPVPGSVGWTETQFQLPMRGMTVFARRSNGQEFPVEVDLTPLRDRDGRVAVGVMIRDISPQMFDQERMLLHLSELAHASRLSTMGEMIAGLAHELNQPLYAVSNYAQACRELVRASPELEAQLAPIADKLSEQTERASQIVRRLRGFVSRRAPQRAALDINVLIHDVEQLMLFHAHRFSITTELRLADDLPCVVVDAILIEQVLVNLLRNAFEAVSEAGVSNGTVVVESSLGQDGLVVVTVADNGSGIGDIDREQLFQPFYTTKEQGMGMGLVISRSIAEAHGGRLTAEARPRGALFRLTLQTQPGKNDD